MQSTLDSKERQKQFILSGSLWSVMWNLSWPAIIAMVLYGLNSVLDAAFVGHFVGETALAGISVAYPLSQISVAFGSLVGVGAGAALSISLGRNDKETQSRLMGNVNALSLIVTILFMVLGLFFSRQMLTAMGGQGEALQFGDEYFRITVFGAIFWVYGLAGNMIVRAEGRMKTAAVMMGAGLLVNALCNYILMGPLHMGVAGAAWGTNIGMLVYTVIGWVYFGRGHASFRSKMLSLRLDKDITSSILRLGMSSLIMNLMWLVQSFVVLNALAKYGTVSDVAFYGVIMRVFNFLLTPIYGLMRALQPVIGINYGAQQYERVIRSYKIFAVTSMLLTIPFWLLSMLAPGFVMGLMLPGQTFGDVPIMYFRVMMAVLPLLSFIFMAMTLFPSIDKGKPAAMVGIARQLVFYVPVMLILPRLMGVGGVYWGSFAIDTVIVLITLALVKKEFGLLRRKQSDVAAQ